MLGQQVNTPADLLYPVSKQGDTVDLEAFVMDQEQALQTAHETARGRSSEERMKRGYDLKVYSRAYEEGDLVYIFDTATVKGKCCKLSPSWKGPGIVIKKHSPYLYRMKTKAAVMVAIHDRLMKYVDRDIPLWLSRYRSSGVLCPRGRQFRSPRLRLGVNTRPPRQTLLCPPHPLEPRKLLPGPSARGAALVRSQGPLVLALSSRTLLRYRCVLLSAVARTTAG